MAGEGSIQTMISILRNNKRLLRKKSLFKDRKRTYENTTEAQLSFKKVTSEELKEEKRAMFI